ncbi:MAG: hypothetical protein N2C14_05530, partial [Planctomycetales bacterium]
MNRIRTSLAWLTRTGAAGLLALNLTGCGGDDSEPKGNVSADSAQTQPSAKPKKTAAKPKGPEHTVKQFLTAVKKGDHEAASGLLTPVARKKTEEAELYVAPPGTPTAQFTVGDFEVKDGGAQVFSTWTDVGEDGAKQTDKIVWILRNEKKFG